jgi:hypothetical protein
VPPGEQLTARQLSPVAFADPAGKNAGVRRGPEVGTGGRGGERREVRRALSHPLSDDRLSQEREHPGEDEGSPDDAEHQNGPRAGVARPLREAT